MTKFRVWTGKEYRYPPMLWEADIRDFDMVQEYSGKIVCIEQSTGITDSYGTEIWECDIVKSIYEGDHSPSFEVEGYMIKDWPLEQEAPVLRNGIKWTWGKYWTIWDALTYPRRIFKVIGNIHHKARSDK